MRFLYTSVFYLALPIILIRLLWRARKAPAYLKRWAERFGFFPALSSTKKVLWIHTVSVGEFIASLPMIRVFQERDDFQLVITTTTPTGSARVQAALGNSVFHVYAPYDVPDSISRFLNRIKPSAVLIMETELWPNTLAACAKCGIPTVLVNGRMSERSARGYAKFSKITRPMLQDLSFALVQSKDDAARLISLGLPPQNACITGSIKFDLTLADDLRLNARNLKQEWSNNGERVIVIAASTHEGEDEIILDAFAQCKKNPAAGNLLLVLVPRHPERFGSVRKLCENRGFIVSKRSDNEFKQNADIVLGDTMGELLLLYGASDIAFVGGSLVPNGGHNFIEPAAWQMPLLSGEYVFNFAEVARLLHDSGALIFTESASQLAEQIEILATDKVERHKRGLAAITVANDNRGALQKTLAAIDKILG